MIIHLPVSYQNYILKIRWFALQKMVCHGQHTYVYSQVLLGVLSQEARGGAVVKRLSQEIVKCAQERYNILKLMS